MICQISADTFLWKTFLKNLERSKMNNFRRVDSTLFFEQEFFSDHRFHHGTSTNSVHSLKIEEWYNFVSDTLRVSRRVWPKNIWNQHTRISLEVPGWNPIFYVHRIKFWKPLGNPWIKIWKSPVRTQITQADFINDLQRSVVRLRAFEFWEHFFRF